MAANPTIGAIVEKLGVGAIAPSHLEDLILRGEELLGLPRTRGGPGKAPGAGAQPAAPASLASTVSDAELATLGSPTATGGLGGAAPFGLTANVDVAAALANAPSLGRGLATTVKGAEALAPSLVTANPALAGPLSAFLGLGPIAALTLGLGQTAAQADLATLAPMLSYASTVAEAEAVLAAMGYGVPTQAPVTQHALNFGVNAPTGLALSTNFGGLGDAGEGASGGGVGVGGVGGDAGEAP